jgi:hypothetical protein
MRDGFCIYTHTFKAPSEAILDPNGRPVVFHTSREAEVEIVKKAMARMQDFLNEEREFEDAMYVDEYVVPVTLHDDGTITDGDNEFEYPKPGPTPGPIFGPGSGQAIPLC